MVASGCAMPCPRPETESLLFPGFSSQSLFVHQLISSKLILVMYLRLLGMARDSFLPSGGSLPLLGVSHYRFTFTTGVDDTGTLNPVDTKDPCRSSPYPCMARIFRTA
uniref:Uncharacterized protein n=1 Tax=Romanomermis culicivorax TaxID=13658 RepID=A0A915JDN7_ROMCU